MRLSRIAILILAGSALLSCASGRVQQYQSIDLTDRSVTVPAGGSALVGALKAALAEDGWQLVVDRGPYVVSGDVNDQIDIEAANTFRTRYRLLVGWWGFDRSYDISFIDNESGAEVFTMTGRALGFEERAVAAVANEFMEALKAASE